MMERSIDPDPIKQRPDDQATSQSDVSDRQDRVSRETQQALWFVIGFTLLVTFTKAGIPRTRRRCGLGGQCSLPIDERSDQETGEQALKGGNPSPGEQPAIDQATSQPDMPKPVVEAAPSESKTSGRRPHVSPATRRALLTILGLALFATLYDGMIGLFPWTKGVRFGGYVNSQAIHTGHASEVVLIDLSQLVPPRDTKQNPRDAKDLAWSAVAHNWRQLDKTVQGLHDDGVRGIAIDWELGLPDKYYSIDGYFNRTMITTEAAAAYRHLLQTMVDVDRSGTPVAFCADAVQEARAAHPETWFPIPEAVPLAASGEGPESSMVDYLATAYAGTEEAAVFPPLNDALAARLGDKLKQSAPLWGFTPFNLEEEERDPQHHERGWRQFWVDFGLVDPHPISVVDLAALSAPEIRKQLAGKVVVLGDIDNDRRETSDTAVIPHLGATPGSFHHASAIATRLVAPVYSVRAEWVELVYLFVISVGFGLMALGSARLVCGIFKWEEGSSRAEWTDAVSEGIVLLLAIAGAWWLQSHLAEHRLLLTVTPIILLVRLTELVIHVRTVWLNRSRHEEEHAAPNAHEGGKA